MTDFVFATNNNNKMREIRAVLAEYGLTARSLADIGADVRADENGADFYENAVIKARACASALDGRGVHSAAVIADDSGLRIDALDGRPGVLSARFLGEDTPYEQKNRAILNMLSDKPPSERTARFVCVMACVLPGGQVVAAEGVVEGVIAPEPRGGNGFGYDPIFLLPEYGKTTAELTTDEKNRVSHRGRALRALIALLEQAASCQ